MFAVIFLVEPKPERWNDYLELAKFLQPKLVAVDGFIDNERFASLRTRGRLLSLSTWRDEKAVVRWRTQAEHHDVQEKGRGEIFADYRLRVGEIIRDTAPPAGHTVAESRLDATAVGNAEVATITELTPEAEAIARRQQTRCRAGSVSTPGATAWSRSRCSKASIVRASSCSWGCGGMPAPPSAGSPFTRRAPLRCGTVRSASFATTACSTAARPRNTIARSSPRAALRRNKAAVESDGNGWI